MLKWQLQTKEMERKLFARYTNALKKIKGVPVNKNLGELANFNVLFLMEACPSPKGKTGLGNKG